MTISRKIRAVVVALLLFAVWILEAPTLADYLVVQKPLEKADAIVILSGSSEYVDRTHEAADLFRLGIAPKVVLTDDGLRGGWDNEQGRNPKFAERAKSELIANNVPADSIEILPELVHGTNDEAEAVVKELGGRGMRSLLLVTSGYHSRRALRAFERAVRRDDLVMTVGVQSKPGSVRSTWWLDRDGWKTVGLELVKTPYYWIFY